MKIRVIFSLGLILLVLLQAASFCLTAKQYYYRAEKLYIKGDLDGALDNVRTALIMHPKYQDAWKLKKTILREKEVLNLILEEEKKRQIAKYLADGEKLFKEGAYAKAIDNFQKALILDPKNEKALSTLKRIREKLIEEGKASRRDYFIRAAVWGAGSLAAAILLTLLMLFLMRGVFKSRPKPKKHLICPNCKAQLPLNEEFCPYCETRVGLKAWKSISESQKRWYGKVGWKRNPFALDIHPEYFTGHKKEVKEILEKISAHSGHILVIGSLGIGKTTLLRWLAAYLPKDLAPIYVPRPPQHFEELIRYIVNSLGFSDKDIDRYDIYNLDKLRKMIGKDLILLLDEAHEFSIEVERPLRTLGDLDGVSLVMAGLPETVSKLENEIQPLFERLVSIVTLEDLNPEELKEMLKARIQGAGGKENAPFTTNALDRIYEISKGNARIALKLADASVTLAISQGEDIIREQLIR